MKDKYLTLKYKPLDKRTKKELLDYKEQLKQLIIMDESWQGPWYGYHLYELGKVEDELKRRSKV